MKIFTDLPFSVFILLLLSNLVRFVAASSSLYSDTFGESFGLGSTNAINSNSNYNSEPEFVEPIANVTVPSGREAILSCVVANLGKFKVGWIRAEDQTILTLDSKVVTHNSRVSVTHDGLQTWNLHLRQVRQSDRGCYMCQINTAIMRKQFGCIDVHVSPNILDDETSTDITVREGDNATLVCRATGHPQPKIIWKREDGEKIILRRGFRDVYKGFENITGDTLQFIRLDRKQMGTFLCIASNDVPPAVSKRITLDVNFAPAIKVPSQLLGAPLGTDVVLECHIEACPKAFSYWMKNRGEMLIDGSKYAIEETRFSYKVYMRLTIRNFAKKDIGIYNCVATNSIGKDEESIRVHEIKMNKVTSSATENQVVTIPGFATPPMSTESRNPVTHTHHHHKSESQWNFGVISSSRDSIDSPNSNHRSPDASNSEGRRSEGSRRNSGTSGNSDISSSGSSFSSSLGFLFIFFILECLLIIKHEQELLLRVLSYR